MEFPPWKTSIALARFIENRTAEPVNNRQETKTAMEAIVIVRLDQAFFTPSLNR